MGLDATVYCNCIERGLLRVPHPYPDLLFLDDDGKPGIHSSDLETQIQHDKWEYGSPCAHDCMQAASERLGNAGGIGYIGDLLADISKRPGGPALPVLLENVLYSGTHCGDFLTILQVSQLDDELQQLKRVDIALGGITRRDQDLIRTLVAKLQKLVDASRLMNKPISF